MGVLLVLNAVIVALWGRLSMTARVAGLSLAFAALVVVVVAPRWDRELLASGAYMYATFVPKDLDLEIAAQSGHAPLLP